jgi:hypothetical protein
MKIQISQHAHDDLVRLASEGDDRARRSVAKLVALLNALQKGGREDSAFRSLVKIDTQPDMSIFEMEI